MNDAANDPRAPSELPTAAIAALERGQTIEAIKIIRLERKCELKAAKDSVDAYLGNRPALRKKLAEAQGEAGQNLAVWLSMLIIVAALVAYLLMNR